LPAVDATPSAPRRLALHALLLASGAAALSAEVAFTRSASLVLGATARSAGVTLAAYLAGLALGAGTAARAADRAPRPGLRLAALFALGAVATALFPFALGTFDALYVPSSPPSAIDSVLAPAVTFVAVALPAAFLGATFPFACRAIGARAGEAGPAVGSLAAFNSAGAVLGALAAPVSISTIGLRASVFSAAAAMAGVALLAAALFPGAHPARFRIDVLRPGPGARGGAAAGPVLFAALAAGGATLSLEILFTRILALDLGGFSGVYGAVIAVFLAGLAVGSGLVPRLRAARRRPAAALFASLAIAAVSAPAGVALLPAADSVARATIVAAAGALGGGPALVAGSAAAAAIVALAPAIALGAVLPLAVAAREGGGGIGRLSGTFSFAQSAGGAAGAIVTGTAWLEFGTTKGGVLLASGALLVAAATVLAAAARGALMRAALLSGPCAAFVASALLVAPGRPIIEDTHVFRGSRGPGMTLVESREESLGIASVVDDARSGERWLYTDGFLAAGTGGDYRYMRLLGHLPALLAPRDRFSAGVVCFGSGTTAAALARHDGAESIAIAEISRRVLELAPRFEMVNGGVLADPRVRCVVDDGRRWLRGLSEPLDVVTLEPLLPYTPGAAALYSEEFYRIARGRLTDGGVFCQWIPLHCVEPRDLASLTGAFAAAFPECALYVFERSAIAIGVKGTLTVDVAAALRRGGAPRVAEGLREAGCGSALEALAGLVLDPAGMAALSRAAEPLRDDRPSLELRALPRFALARHLEANFASLLDLSAEAGARADFSGLDPASAASAESSLEGLVAAHRSILRARAFEDRSLYLALTGDAAGARSALDAARRTLDAAIALSPGHARLKAERRRLD